jgi:conjugal transfer pilus assembly protein TraK
MARRISPRCWATGCALALAALASPAFADQFKQAADGSAIDCAVSARELTRFALIDDQFASVSKISTGTPYNDFAVTNEPLRGDIYISVPETYAARSISFFATTKKGYVYKVGCRVEAIDAAQIFITNPAITSSDAARWEDETPIATTAVRLIQAMANDRTVEGFSVRQSSALPVRVGDLELQLIASYRGASLAGKVMRVTNRGSKVLTLAEHDFAPRDTIAVAIASPSLEPAASTTAFVVGANGDTDHD